MTGTLDTMETMKDLGERIRAKRIAAKHSVKSAAKDSGIARDTWRKIELGESVQDTKRHIAMQFLGMLDTNEQHASVPDLGEYAADRSGPIDLNMMFVQAVRFPATIGSLVPDLHDEVERVTVALSALYTSAIQIMQEVDDLDDLLDYKDEDLILTRNGVPIEAAEDEADVMPAEQLDRAPSTQQRDAGRK